MNDMTESVLGVRPRLLCFLKRIGILVWKLGSMRRVWYRMKNNLLFSADQLLSLFLVSQLCYWKLKNTEQNLAPFSVFWETATACHNVFYHSTWTGLKGVGCWRLARRVGHLHAPILSPILGVKSVYKGIDLQNSGCALCVCKGSINAFCLSFAENYRHKDIFSQVIQTCMPST